MNIRPVGAEFFHADRGIDMTKLIVGFPNFQTAPRNTHHVKLLQATTVVQSIVFHLDLSVLIDTFISIFNEIHRN
jgi:hypothetical protein